MIKKFNFLEINDEELKEIKGSGIVSTAYGYLFSNAGDILKQMTKRQSYYDHLYKDFK